MSIRYIIAIGLLGISAGQLFKTVYAAVRYCTGGWKKEDKGSFMLHEFICFVLLAAAFGLRYIV